MQTNREYWLVSFTGETWQEFLTAGANVTGFRENSGNVVQQIKPGDYLLCYVTGVMTWIGVLEAIGGPYHDETRVWSIGLFPERVPVKPVFLLEIETAVPIHEMHDQLSIFAKYEEDRRAWSINVRKSPTKWSRADGEAVTRTVQSAVDDPIIRDVDRAKLARRPRVLLTDSGPVTVPESDPPGVRPTTPAETSAHTEIQWLLLKMGSDMGLDVWVARNDRNRTAFGERFSDLPQLLSSLPYQFDDATNRTIELIDVLWLNGKSIAAAFEIESTTSIYSGLLRMSDLISMQPNINIPLYLVAPDERRGKVMEEVNRPTFSRLTPPMSQVCRYISFTALRAQSKAARGLLKYLKPDFLDEIAETCEVSDA